MNAETETRSHFSAPWRRTGAALVALAVTVGLAGLACFASQPVLARPAAHGRSWAFTPPVRPPLPTVRNAAWATNPIDRFVLAKLESAGLQPSPPADRRTLLRRVAFDLSGLPPTPEETDAFLADRSPTAYEKVVDRLLASPHYGERWARHWLDLARFAESEGFKNDEMRPNAWRYRDYVISAFNADKPYDRFVKEQIAGDELWPDDSDALTATAFCRHWADESNARDLFQRRQEILDDVTDTVGSTLLGLTWGCARCHDHKYEAIPQKDYFRLQAFFAGIRPRDDIPLIPSDKRPEYERKMAEWDAKTRDIRAEMEAIEEPIRKKIAKVSFDKFPEEIQSAITRPARQRTAMDWFLYHKAEPYFRVSMGDVQKQMKPEALARWKELSSQLDAFKQLYPGEVPTTLGITDLGLETPKTYTLAVGLYNRPLEEVRPGFPGLCGGGEPAIRPIERSGAQSSGRRAALAEWLASPSNPLTARVMVNRIWQYHFGQGIVGTASDFGSTGEPPTHRELLDWLTAEFMQRGWSMKHIHRLILTSNTYQQASRGNPIAEKKDPANRLLGRFHRQRLDGESVRDAILAASGELNPKIGGPSVMPAIPSGVTTRGYWKETPDPSERNRRSIYVFVKRNMRFPLFEAFDFPDTHEPCSRREVTTTAPQALMLMNDETVLQSARRFAERVMHEAGTDAGARMDRAYRIAFGRPPTAKERQAALTFLARQAAIAGGETEALTDLCHALLNANEFVYVD